MEIKELSLLTQVVELIYGSPDTAKTVRDSSPKEYVSVKMTALKIINLVHRDKKERDNVSSTMRL